MTTLSINARCTSGYQHGNDSSRDFSVPGGVHIQAIYDTINLYHYYYRTGEIFLTDIERGVILKGEADGSIPLIKLVSWDILHIG